MLGTLLVLPGPGLPCIPGLFLSQRLTALLELLGSPQAEVPSSISILRRMECGEGSSHPVGSPVWSGLAPPPFPPPHPEPLCFTVLGPPQEPMLPLPLLPLVPSWGLLFHPCDGTLECCASPQFPPTPGAGFPHPLELSFQPVPSPSHVELEGPFFFPSPGSPHSPPDPLSPPGPLPHL